MSLQDNVCTNNPSRLRILITFPNAASAEEKDTLMIGLLIKYVPLVPPTYTPSYWPACDPVISC